MLHGGYGAVKDDLERLPFGSPIDGGELSSKARSCRSHGLPQGPVAPLLISSNVMRWAPINFDSPILSRLASPCCDPCFAPEMAFLPSRSLRWPAIDREVVRGAFIRERWLKPGTNFPGHPVHPSNWQPLILACRAAMLS